MVKRNDKYCVEFNNMFREYDIRGQLSDKELNEDSVYRIIKAYAKYLLAKNITRAVVGYDNRECSPGFAEAAIRALREMGIDTWFIGMGISPLVYFAQYHLDCDGAVMITASHNPSNWSGFKLGLGKSKTLQPDDIQAVYDLLDTPDGDARQQGSFTETNVRDAYLDDIVGRIKMGPKKLRVAMDAGNGGAGVFAYELFQRLGCMTFQLYCDPDIRYPQYFPNPSNVEARKRLREMVLHPYIKADVGLGFDGDGDRLGVIDEKGEDIWSDIVLAVLAKQLLEKKPGATVVFDVKSSQTLIDVIKQEGGVPVMWKTGHSYIKAKMHELGAPLAGERSGHTFFGGDIYYGFDDAMFVGAKLVEYLSWQDESVSEIISHFPHYVTSPEIKTFCRDDLKYGIVDQIVAELKAMFPGKVFDVNGARVSFDKGWGLVRASSNLPELVLVFEGEDVATVKHIHKIFKDVLAKYPDVSPDWENDNVEAM